MSHDDESRRAAPDAFPDEVGFSRAMTLAWRLYRSSLRSLIGPFLLVAALGVAVNLAGEIAAAGVGPVELQFLLIFFLPATAYVTLGSVAVAAAGPLFGDRVTGGAGSFAAALGPSRRSLRDMLAAGLFASVIALCVIALLTPLVYFFVLSFFYGPPIVAHVVSVEGRRLRPALARSRHLLRGSVLRVAGLVLTVALGIGLVKASLLQLFVSLPYPARVVATILSQVAADSLLLPFLAAASFVAYLDLRVRREQFALEDLRAERAATHR